jgi:tetraacyldisaccharide 4'-kinase
MGLLAFIYHLITSFRNKLYDFGILKIKSIEGVNITCIGNITVGGTGKTPAVQYFTKKYLSAGKKVAIVSRRIGEKGKKILL